MCNLGLQLVSFTSKLLTTTDLNLEVGGVVLEDAVPGLLRHHSWTVALMLGQLYRDSGFHGFLMILSIVGQGVSCGLGQIGMIAYLFLKPSVGVPHAWLRVARILHSFYVRARRRLTAALCPPTPASHVTDSPIPAPPPSSPLALPSTCDRLRARLRMPQTHTPAARGTIRCPEQSLAYEPDPLAPALHGLLTATVPCARSQTDPVFLLGLLLYYGASSGIVGIEFGPAIWALGVAFFTMPAMHIVAHVACERAHLSLHQAAAASTSTASSMAPI